MRAAPSVFDCDETGIARINDGAAEHAPAAELRLAVRLCPVQAIRLSEGKRA